MSAAKSNGSTSAAAAAPAPALAAAPVTVFVAGGTSNTGSAAIQSLLQFHANATVRAGVRDLKKATEKFAVSGSVPQRLTFAVHDVKGGHLTAAASAAADAAELKGVDTLLLVPPQGYGDRIGVATAYAAAAKAAGVKLIVVISSPAVSNPKLVLSKDLAATEQVVAASGVPYVFLRAVFFYENHWGNKATLSAADGSAAFYSPIKADVPIQSVAVQDIGEAAANVLVGGSNGVSGSTGTGSGVAGSVKAHGGKAYWIGGPALTHSAMAGVFSRVLNKPVAFHSASDDAAVKALGALGWPETMARGLCELYHYYEAGAYAENTSALQALLNGGRAPTTLSQWLVRSGAAAAFGGVQQTVFVAGAAGNTGSATVKALLRDHPYVSVRAGVRDAKKAEGVFASELADATAADSATAAAAAADSAKAAGRLTLAVHDVKNGHLTAAGSDAADAAELKGVDTLVLVPPQGSGDRVGVADAYLRAAKAAGVKHVLAITSPGVVQPQLLLTSGLAATESAVVRAYGGAHTFVRPVFFFENHFGSADTIKGAAAAGGGAGAIYGPIAGDARLPGIAVRDIGEATANAATWGGAAGADRKGHHGRAYAVAGQVLTSDEQAAVFGRVKAEHLRLKAAATTAGATAADAKAAPTAAAAVKFVSVTDAGCVQALTAKGFPEIAAKGFVELYRGFESGAFGADAYSTAALQSLLNENRQPTRLDQWLQPIAAAFI